MLKKVLSLFNSRKLANYTWFFGCMVLGIAAIIGMVWAYCRANPIKQKRRASAGTADTCTRKWKRTNECL